MVSIMMIAMLISLIMFFLYILIYFNNDLSLEKKSSFECGFEPLSEMRTPFSLRFFILVILFLIFDIEISLLFPIISIMSLNSSLNLKIALLIFLSVLLCGLFHEWNEGAIDWVSS
uniref:NADH-ubiquinone oxidoreductase chain 3 n=1 Tax=Planorbella pilsbryi TaxID=2823525 RepID=A0A8E8PES1_9GAST|nr:NADH dehydrogenase subunit 3 [Planorbella pilsbryi]